MAFAGGTGTALDPYLVATAEQLNDVRNYLTSCFKQIEDIDLSSYTNWIPIGQDTEFSGTYDGNRLNITNLTINNEEQDVGLFGMVASYTTAPAALKNINLINIDISGYTHTGALVGWCIAQISNCTSTNGQVSGSSAVGGLIGNALSSNNFEAYISDCYSNCTVSGSSSVGSLVGYTNLDYSLQIWTPEDLNNVRNNLSGKYIQMADIDLSVYENWIPIGDNATPFSGCYDGQNYKISNLTINRPTECTIGLFGNVYFDGLTEVAILKNINIVNANITGMQTVGILGGLVAGNITNCHASGTIIADKEVGGLIGTFWDRGYEITDVNISKMISCSADCTITSSGDSNGSVGGLIGSSTVYLIENCYSSGDINALLHDTTWDVGGFIGVLNKNAFSGSIIRDCYSTSNLMITCDSSGSGGDIGGFIGSLDLATLINCYSVGSLTIVPNGAFSIEDVGGFIGYNWNGATITVCYYNSETSGQSDNDGRGIPKTTADMKDIGTYTGWDMGEWTISPTVNDGYPYLSDNTTGIVEGDTMGLSSRKITTYAKNVADLPDRPNENGYTAATLKAFFDGRGDEEIKASINGIVDDLVAKTDGTSGADQVGATKVGAGTAETVQGILEELHARIVALEP